VWQVNINNDELITRNIVDLSPSGLSFKAPQRSQFEPGQVITLKVNLGTEKSFEVEGKIIWTKDKQFGLKFSKVPVFIDTFIMKAIQEWALRPSLEVDSRVAESLSIFRSSRKKIEANWLLSTTMALITVAAMTAALVTAAYIHQQRHPEESLSNISTQFFQKINNGPGK